MALQVLAASQICFQTVRKLGFYYPYPEVDPVIGTELRQS